MIRVLLQKPSLIQPRILSRRSLIPLNKNISFNPLTQRSYSQSAPSKLNTKRDIPSFANIFFMALVGTGIFVFAVNSLERTKKKTTYADSEYANILKGLRRRVTLFNPGELTVNFIYPTDDEIFTKKILKEEVESGLVIDPFEVVEELRNDPDGRYEAILNDIKSVYADGNYIDHLPEKMLVSLLKDYIKRHCQKGDTVTIINFPKTMSDAMNFENEISQIKQIYIPKGESDSNICKYFETVDKVSIK